MRKHLAILPNVLTFGVLIAGLSAITALYTQNFTLSLRLILLAVLLDGLDGSLARHLNATSELGKQLDSLADLIAFGAAPALLLLTKAFRPGDFPGYVAAIFFCAAGAYRLARFNTTLHRETFSGLPITIAGGLLACSTLLLPFTNKIFWVLALLAMCTLAFLMVSKIEYPCAKSKRQTVMGLCLRACTTVILWGMFDYASVALAVLLLSYTCSGPLGIIRRSWHRPGFNTRFGEMLKLVKEFRSSG